MSSVAASDVAVILPCRNGEPWLGPALRSVLAQTARPAEIVVADDGSTDASDEVAKAYGARVISGPFHGAAPARSAGLAATEAPYVLFLDADDLLGPDALFWLRRAVKPRGAARCAWQDLFLQDGAWMTGPPRRDPRGVWQDNLSAWLTGWYAPPCAVLWSREAVEAAGGWADRQMVNDDGDLMMRALAGGMELYVAEGGTAFYRKTPSVGGTLSSQRFSQQGLQDRLEIIAGIEARIDRLAPYRGALAQAYRQIELDSADHPDIANEARRARQALQVSLRHLGAMHLARRASARVSDTLSPERTTRTISHAEPQATKQADPIVSVVIPTFNRPTRTVRAVRSVLAQTVLPAEILVVDDASTDGTAEAVEALANPLVKLIRQSTNGGVAAARNRGVEESRGNWIAFLDSDDEWLPTKLQRQLDALESTPENAIVYTGSHTRGPDGTVETRITDNAGALFETLLVRNVLHGASSSALIPRAVFDTVGGFDPSLPANEDWDFWLRVARFYAFFPVDAPLVRINDDGKPDRRSLSVENDLAARATMRQRYALDTAAAGLRQPVAMEAARTHLDAGGRHAWQGRFDILRALVLGPGNFRLYPWLPYMLLPTRARSLARRIDARSTPRPVRAGEPA